MSKRNLRAAVLLATALVLAFFATGCDQFLSSALIYLSQNPPQYDKAISSLNEGLTVIPDNGVYYRWLAYCYFENKQYKESHDAYDKAIKFLPDRKDSLEKARQSNWEDLYRAALNPANRIAKATPDSVQFFTDKAQKALDNAITFLPDKDQNYMLRAFILRKTGKDDEARKMYEKMIEINPKNTDALIALASYAFNAGNYAKAEEYYVKVLETNPADTTTYTRLGICYFNESKFAQAVEPFRKAALLDTTNRIALMQWATAIIDDGKNLGNAFEPLEKARRLKEDDEIWKLIGVNALRMTPPDYDRAENAFKKATQFNDKVVDYWKYLHDIYVTKKMKAELKETDKKIKELEPK